MQADTLISHVLQYFYYISQLYLCTYKVTSGIEFMDIGGVYHLRTLFK